MFEDQIDVEEWLATLDYASFWREADLFRLVLPTTRGHCDELIAAGAIDEATILTSVKAFARLELLERYQLPARRPTRVRRH